MAAAAGVPRAFRVDTGFSLPGELALVLLTLLVMVFLVYPTAWIIVASFKTPATMFSSTRFDFTLENYVALFQTGFARNILNSLYLCIGAVLISTFVSTIAAERNRHMTARTFRQDISRQAAAIPDRPVMQGRYLRDQIRYMI